MSAAIGVFALSAALVAAVGRPAPPAGDVRLVDAMQRQDADAVRALVKAGVDVNASQPDGATPLAWAAHWNDLASADLLIKAGANVNAANELGMTPLMLAAFNGSGAMVDRLLSAGADARATRPTGETALMMAARSGNIETVKRLIAGGADVNANTVRGQTALMWAGAERHVSVARALLEVGADVNAQSAKKVPQRRNFADAALTDEDLAKGSRPLLKNNEAMNPAIRRELMLVRDWPTPEGGFTPLLYATMAGDQETLKVLLDGGASIDSAAADGTTPLILALVKGHTQLALYLLERGANANVAGTGFTALHVAAATGQQPAVTSLLAHGADPNSRLEKPVRFTEAFIRTMMTPGAGWHDIKGATPYMIAARSVNVAIMRELQAAGANPKTTAEDGTTAVMLAAGLAKAANADIGYYTWDEARALEAIKAGLDAGIDINATNQDGETALHGATYHAANTLIQYLVEHGANLNATNWQKQTPLLIAQGHLVCCTSLVRHPTTVELLRKLGADPNAGTQLNFGLSADKADGTRSSSK